MSLFDSFDEMFAQVQGAAMKAYEENQKYRSVTSLTFKPVPAEKAKALKAANTGLFGLGFLGGLFGRDKAKFIESIEQYTQRSLCSQESTRSLIDLKIILRLFFISTIIRWQISTET